jgi:putative endonuclease
VLKSEKTDEFYTGCTNNIKKRIQEHNNGDVCSTRYKRPLQPIYFEACLNKDDAFRRERYLKTTVGKRYIRKRLERGLTG